MTEKSNDTVYLAGPMTGIPKFNFPTFDRVAKKYRNHGFDVFNPADHDRKLLGKDSKWVPEAKDSEGPWMRWAIPGAPSLREMLGADLAWIAKEANYIVMLPGWENSKGANAEWALAKALGLKIYYE